MSQSYNYANSTNTSPLLLVYKYTFETIKVNKIIPSALVKYTNNKIQFAHNVHNIIVN